MIVTNIKISPLDTGTGSRDDVYLTSENDRRVTGLNGVVWEPSLVKAPSISIALWNGTFDAAVDPGNATLPVNLEVLRQTYPDVVNYVWAGAPVEIYAAEMGTAWPWPLVFRGVVTGYSGKYPYLNLQAAVDVEPFDADVLTATYAGSGGVEGGDDLKNRVKPLILGHAKNVEPVLINATDSVYQFSGHGAIEAVTALYERGSQFTSTPTDYADYAALVGATIAPGTWATCLAHGLVRLGAPAAGLITGDVKGHKVGASTPTLTGAVINALATIAGVSSSLIETATLSAMDAAVPRPIDVVITDQDSFLEWAKRLALPCNWQAGISLTGTFFVAEVDLAASPQITLDAQGRYAPPVVACEEMDVSPPFYRTTMGANRCWRVHTADEIAFFATLVYRGLYDAAETYREGEWVDLADGSTWIYINPAPTAGNAPPAWPTTSNTWWENRTPPLAVAVTGFLTNPAHVVTTATNGSGGDYSDAGGRFYLVQGDTFLSTGVVWSVASATAGLSISINSATGVYTVTGMTVDQGTATLRATYAGKDYDQVYTLAKAKAGAGSIAMRLIASRLAITYDSGGAASPASQTNVLIAEKQNTSATVTWTVTDGLGNPKTPTTSYLSAATGDAVTMTVAQFASAQSGTGTVIITATLVDGSTTITDKVSVSKIQAGANGANGADGAPAIGYVQATMPASGDFVNQTWYNTSTKRWWRWTGSAWAVILGDLSAVDIVGTGNIDSGAIGTATRWYVTGTVGITSVDGWYPVVYGVGITVTHEIKFDAHLEVELSKAGPVAGETVQWEWKIVRSTTSYPTTYTDVTNVFREKYNYPGAGGPTTNALDYRTASMQDVLSAQPSGTYYYHIMARVVTTGWAVAFQSARRNLSILNQKRQV